MKNPELKIALVCLAAGAFSNISASEYSLSYNILEPGFEARYAWPQGSYLAVNPVIASVGTVRDPSGTEFPNLHTDVMMRFYGYGRLLDFMKYATLGVRAGFTLEQVTRDLSDVSAFLAAGLRFHAESGDHWFFESTTYPIGYSFHTLNDEKHVKVFTEPTLELGIGYRL